MHGIQSLCRRCLGGLALLSLLGGCATQGGYDPFRDTDFKGPTLQAVRTGSDPNTFRNTRVRWGGSIAGVENRRAETWVEIVQHPLGDSGRPRAGAAGEGRFIARIGGFLDPAIYAEGRQITVIGPLTDSVQRNIGEYPYQFPVVTAEQYRLWEERREPEVIYYHDPFWDPWYWPRPWYYRPYRRH
jgi:outer membrane lipoprotein